MENSSSSELNVVDDKTDEETIQQIAGIWRKSMHSDDNFATEQMKMMFSFGAENVLFDSMAECAFHADFVTKTAVDRGLRMLGNSKGWEDKLKYMNATSVANAAYIVKHSPHEDERQMALSMISKIRDMITAQYPFMFRPMFWLLRKLIVFRYWTKGLDYY